MLIEVDFPGGKRVNAHFGRHVVYTDQPRGAGGDGSAPSPFSLFLASLATCAGYYVLSFCQQRGIDTEGLRLIQEHVVNSVTGHTEQVRLEIILPPGFPMKYQAAVIRAAEQCAVKKLLDHPPAFEIQAHLGDAQPA